MDTRLAKRELLERDPVLAEIVRRLVETCHPERIYLFGSVARGEAGPESDYDILLSVDRPKESRCRLSQRGFRALRGVSAAVDIVVWDRETFDYKAYSRMCHAWWSVISHGAVPYPGRRTMACWRSASQKA